MARAADIESDPFFELLTDALRAGPGSPQWHQAVQKLRQNGDAGADEFRLLREAREHLESGRDYRSVRPGPGFTRRLFNEIEEQGAARSGAPTATIITVFSALAILGVVVVVAVLMSRGGGPRPEPQTSNPTRSSSC